LPREKIYSIIMPVVTLHTMKLKMAGLERGTSMENVRFRETGRQVTVHSAWMRFLHVEYVCCRAQV